TENLNQTLEVMLRAYVAEDKASWSKYLAELMFAYNTTEHGSTGYTPSFLLMGYYPR
ncbi:hypothetical protein GGG16DRAFT_29184, partial [Schizophyllum commune]